MNKWYNVNVDARVWAGHSESHKMGWMRAGSAILAVEEYKNAVRFVEYKEPSDLKERGSGYPEWWMQLKDLSLEPMPVPTPVPSPVPVPGPVPQTDDAELGAALRLLVNFIRQYLLGR